MIQMTLKLIILTCPKLQNLNQNNTPKPLSNGNLLDLGGLINSGKVDPRIVQASV